MRDALKSILETVAGGAFVRRMTRGRLRGARLVLAYHNVVAHETRSERGDSSLHLPIDAFRSQLDAILEAGLTVVRVDAPAAASDAPPEVAITFDDAYAGAMTLGVHELALRRLPATVFVAPGLLGCPSPWWDRLADAETGVLAPSLRDRLLSDLRGDGEAILAESDRHGWPTSNAHPAFRIVSDSDLSASLTTHPSLSYGAHSWSHANLAALSAAELDQELTTSLAWLRQRWPDRTIPWLAYPYGLDSPLVNLRARVAGFAGAFRVSGGWNRGATNVFALPRLNVPAGMSTAGFRARLSGVL